MHPVRTNQPTGGVAYIHPVLGVYVKQVRISAVMSNYKTTKSTE
jgi:hypothetical protein